MKLRPFLQLRLSIQHILDGIMRMVLTDSPAGHASPSDIGDPPLSRWWRHAAYVPSSIGWFWVAQLLVSNLRRPYSLMFKILNYNLGA